MVCTTTGLRPALQPQDLISEFYFIVCVPNEITFYLLFLHSTLIPSLSKNSTASHECSVVFFTPGRFKVDIQCKTQQALSAIPTVNNDSHIWKFIPQIEITVN